MDEHEWMDHLQRKYDLATLDVADWFASLAQESKGCPKCNAELGAPCRMPSGRKSSELHGARIQKEYEDTGHWYNPYHAFTAKLCQFWLAHNRREDWTE
jgi:hypothetical protein